MPVLFELKLTNDPAWQFRVKACSEDTLLLLASFSRFAICSDPCFGVVAMTKTTGKAGKNNSVPRVGLLNGKVPGPSLDVNLYDAGHSVEALFGDLAGAALLESILKFYQDTELLHVPWFSDDGQGTDRNVVRASQSRAIQESTVARYMDRIYNEGLSQVVSGQHWGIGSGLKILTSLRLTVRGH